MITKKMRDSFKSQKANNCNKSFYCKDKPLWSDHDFPAICMCGGGNWFGLHEAVKPFYSEQWKGKEVTLLRGQAEFLKHGENTGNEDIENLYEVRPEKATNFNFAEGG